MINYILLIVISPKLLIGFIMLQINVCMFVVIKHELELIVCRHGITHIFIFIHLNFGECINSGFCEIILKRGTFLIESMVSVLSERIL